MDETRGGLGGNVACYSSRSDMFHARRTAAFLQSEVSDLKFGIPSF